MNRRSAGYVAAALLLTGCSKVTGGSLLPDASMPLTTVITPMFTTSVPTGWTIHILGGRMMEAFDPNTVSETNRAQLYFSMQGATETCSGEKVELNEGPACVTAKTSSADKATGSVVEVQAPTRMLRLTHNVGELEKPVPVSVLRALAIRILNANTAEPGPAALAPKPPPPQPQPTAEQH